MLFVACCFLLVVKCSLLFVVFRVLSLIVCCMLFVVRCFIRSLSFVVCVVCLLYLVRVGCCLSVECRVRLSLLFVRCL